MAISLGGFSGGGAGAVSSVNGQTGVVVVSGDDVAADHSASNYTAANANVDGHLSGIDTKLGTLAAGLTYKGTFNATAGTPSLANAEQGDLYVIDTAGTIYGNTFAIGDHLLVNADMGGSISNSKIDKIDNTEPTNVLITTNNLSDLTSASTARTNLGLGSASTSASTDFLQVANNLSDLNSASTARTNLGLGNVATLSTGVSNGNVIVADSTGLPAIDGSQLTNVTATDSTKLAIANNLSDLNNATTARTNLGLGTAATLNSGTSNGNVVVLDSTGLPAVDGSQLTGITATDSTKLAIANNLSDLNSASTARTNLGLGTAATLNSGTSNGNVVVLDSTGLPAVDGSQLTNVTATDSTKLAIANNLSDLNSASTARTNLGLGTAATLDAGTGASNLVQLNGSSQLPAVDGSNLTNVGKFIDYSVLSSNANIFKNRGYNISANSLTLTLPARSTLTDGDSIAFTSAASYSLTIQLNSADSSTSNIFYNVATATNASSHTITINKQEIFIRFNGSSFLITSETKGGIASVSADTAPSLGGNLDVGTSDIVSSSNNNIEFAANGTGVVKVKPTASGGHLELNGDGTNVGKLRLMCEQSSHGIYLTGPSHSASASYTLKFPDTAGTANYVLKTDGSGNLDWVAQASGGGSAPTVTSASPGSNYTITTHADNEEIYLLNPSTDISVLLPAASSCGSGYKYQIKNLSTNTLTIDPNGSEYIDHSGQTTFAIDQQYTNITLVTDGSNWFII